MGLRLPWWGLWLCLCICTAVPSSVQGQSSNPIRILEVEGTVEILPVGGNGWRRAETNEILRAGDRIRTSQRSRVSLRWSDLSVIRISELADLEIRPPPPNTTGSSFSLVRGLLYFFHRDRPANARFNTRTASAAIRGTDLVLEAKENGETILSVLDGEADLSNDQGTTSVKSNEQGVAKPGEAPRTQPLLQAVNVIQWVLHYPAVLDLHDLDLEKFVVGELAPSIEAYRKGDLQQAAAQYPTGRQPANDSERIYLAALSLASGQVSPAERLLDGFKGQAGVSREGRLANALRRMIAAVKFTELPDVASSGTATEWLASSYYEQSRSNLEAALAHARSAAQKSPRFSFAWARVAELEFSFGHVDAAYEAVGRALYLAPRNAYALSLKGFLEAAKGRFAEAERVFTEAIGIDGSLGQAWLGRGLVKIRRGESVAGREDVQVAATLEPQRAVYRSYLGKAYDHVGDGRRAASELTLARKLDPNDPTGWFYSALIDVQENRINRAVRRLEHAQDLNENRGVYRSQLLLDQDRAVRSVNLAGIYQDAGMTDVSIREAARAVSYDYANYSAHLFLANSYAVQDDPRQNNLRFETPRVNEYLIANLLSPVGGTVLSPIVSQQEYSRLFDTDHFGLGGSTEYLSRGAWTQFGSQYGRIGGTAYSLDAYYLTDPGQGELPSIEQLTMSAQVKQQITTKDSVYFQALYATSEANDFPGVAGLNIDEKQEPLLLAGFHHEWNPGIHTLFLAGRLHDRLEVTNPVQSTLILQRPSAGAAPTALLPITVAQDYESQFEAYTAEAQQILQTERQALIVGGRYQQGEFETRNRHTISPLVIGGTIIDPSFFENPPQSLKPDLERHSAYSYYHVDPLPQVRLIGGVTYDYLRYPVNFRFAPLADGEESTSRVSPKAGFILTPWKDTSIRGAYTRGLGGVSFDQSFRLEPSQVAGINQAYRSIIPEVVAGANAAPTFETWGLTLDHKLPSQTYLGLHLEMLESEVDRIVGTFDLLPPEIVFPLPPFIFPSGTREHLEYRERTLLATVNQLVGEEWSFGARYRLSKAELENRFPEITPAVAASSGFNPSRDTEAILQQANMFAIYNHSSGFFGQVDSLWTAQNNDGNLAFGDEDFWQFNAFIGYRAFRRHLVIRVGLLNITDQSFRLNQLTLTPELPRERTLAVNLRFYF